MFVWRAERFLDELERTSPTTRRAVEAHLAGRRRAWERAPKRSVDYAVMERARGVRVVPLDAGWDDVGSWAAAARLREATGRTERDEALAIDSAGSVVFGETGRLVVLLDAPGLVVVDTEDALLVVGRESTERVREVVERLRERRRDLV
jgi:mannose-1-phosphate guanylyltransferase